LIGASRYERGIHPALQLEKDARNGLLAALKQLQLDIEPLRDRPGRPAGTFGIV
jgi:hypothetical protein